MRVYTARINYKGQDALNITVKDNPSHPLSPTWDMVMGHKQGRYTNQQYTDMYLQLLRTRYAKDPTRFLRLFERTTITLECYCAYGKFCHRHIAVKVLAKIAKSKGLDFHYMGERSEKLPSGFTINGSIFNI